MSAKQGFLGLSPAGGVAALGAVAAVIAGIFYATGALGPRGEDPAPQTAALPQAEAPVAAAPQPVTQTPAEATVIETAEEPQPEAPAEETTAEAQPEAPAEEASAEPQPEDPAEETTAEAQPETPAEEATAEAPSTAAEPAPLSAPRFDVVRAAPDGMTVVAGQSAPGSTVTVLLDGSDLDTVTADAGGEFVAILALTPSTLARVLTLRATQDDRTALSVEEIILAPAPAPVTEAEPEPAPQDSPADTVTAEAAPITTEPTKTEPTTTEPTSATTLAATPAADPAPEAETAPAAPTSIAVLRADAQGVELLQPAAPAPDAPPAQILLDTIGYASDGAVLLSGRAAARAPIRVYLDNRAVTDLAAAEDGRWRAALADVTPGVYTLRLDALGADGAVISRLETPFLREAPEALAAAEAAAAAPPPAPPARQLTVQAGDTLWAISRERYGDGMLFVRVFEANRDAIRNPDLIYPGQVFTIPD